MAIAFVQDFAGSDGFASSFTATVPAGGIPAGHHLIVALGCADSSFTVSSITDDSSNTYTVHDSQVQGGNKLVLASGYIGTALNAGDTITVTLAGATGGSAVFSEFSGLASASYFDQSAKANIAFDTVWSSGSTATTTQADELIFGLAYSPTSGVAFTPGSGFTETDEENFFSAWTQHNQYKVVAATGTYASNGTTAAGAEIIAMVGTFKADAAGTDATVTAVAATSTAASVAPPKPRPTAPFSEINVRM